VSVETTQRLTRRQLLIRIGAVVAVILLIAGILVYYRWRLSVQQRRLDATMANFQAFIADSQGRLTEAQSLFIRAIALDPTVARYWRDLGDFYYRQELEGRTKAERMRDAAGAHRHAVVIGGGLLGLETARALEPDQVEVRMDSQVVVNQMLGLFAVRKASLRRLHARARAAVRSPDWRSSRPAMAMT